MLTDIDIVQPDLIFIAKERLDIVGETYVREAPDLAVEILSPSTRKLDLRLKRDLYERHGVREYWIVDPDLETIDDLKKKFEEASKYADLDQLGIAPQCGFASTEEGNAITPDDQRRKLELVVQTAEAIWGGV